jgi:glycerophosphoryl diester phosphodiesterase
MPDAAPADRPEVSYDVMMTPEGLATVATYADAVGVAKAFVLDPASLAPTTLVADAHAAGLDVHVWTVRVENAFLPPSLRSASGRPGDVGDLDAEVRALVSAGVDGLFTDHPGLVLAALGR